MSILPPSVSFQPEHFGRGSKNPWLVFKQISPRISEQPRFKTQAEAFAYIGREGGSDDPNYDPRV